MTWVPHTDADREILLGDRSFESLIEGVPRLVRLERPLNLPPGISEPE